MTDRFRTLGTEQLDVASSVEVWAALDRAAIEAANHSTAAAHVVGAAIEASDSKIYVGTNLEANNHRSTIHAEDGALSAMAQGGFSLKALRLVTVAADYDSSGVLGNFYYTYPCGSCRNILFEFTEYDTPDELQVWWDSAPRKLSEVFPIGLDSVPVNLSE